MERRDLFRILAAGAAMPMTEAEAAAYEPRFFSKAEFESLDRICEAILPKDDEGGGAHDAGVAAYIDTVILHSSPELQKSWRTGLTSLVSVPIDRLAERESDPFFSRLKAITIEAFFNSKVGYEYVGYKGNSGRLVFPGCTHPEHK
jgi:hypothetical protein